MNLSLSHTTKVVRGEITLPSSKSISNRALIIKALSGLPFEIENLSTAEDTQVLQRLLTDKNRTIFDVGQAGTAMRFLTAYLAIQQGEFILIGSERMQQRPIKVLVDVLRTFGADITYLKNEGFPPLKIIGKPLLGGEITMDGSISSQYVSALMMIAPYLKNGLKINFAGQVASKPYLDMTAEMMKSPTLTLPEGEGIFSPFGGDKRGGFVVEPDWSAASYWYSVVALAKDAEITLLGLKKKSLQGDSVVAEIFEKFGVKTDFIENGIRLTKSSDFGLRTSDFQLNFTNCPDLAQTVAVTSAALNVPSKLTGLSTLRIKETDRIAALQIELTRLGFNVEVDGDDLIVNRHSGKIQQLNHWSSISVHTYDDHRMAMAFAPLSLLSPITIENPGVVVKSYPNFWEDLRSVGVELKE
ncbi:MAG: 3-phosphoshikimate 1-carboxyvinyltransferase [Flavobacteriales bacterium]|nr:3-phosphoshikimate 1-carboxyvinyltransferase [Flavobacteriales bacterium]